MSTLFWANQSKFVQMLSLLGFSGIVRFLGVRAYSLIIKALFYTGLDKNGGLTDIIDQGTY